MVVVLINNETNERKFFHSEREWLDYWRKEHPSPYTNNVHHWADNAYKELEFQGKCSIRNYDWMTVKPSVDVFQDAKYNARSEAEAKLYDYKKNNPMADIETVGLGFESSDSRRNAFVEYVIKVRVYGYFAELQIAKEMKKAWRQLDLTWKAKRNNGLAYNVYALDARLSEGRWNKYHDKVIKLVLRQKSMEQVRFMNFMLHKVEKRIVY